MGQRSGRDVVLLAWVNVILHASGLIAAALALRPGTPLVPLQERMAYLASRPWGWSVGWGLWILCALALVAFLASLVPHLNRVEGRATLAVVLAGAGAAIDLSCNTLFIVLLPSLAQEGATSLFLAFERALGAGGAVVANGLYSLSVLVVVRSLPTTPGWTLARLLGYATFLAGSGLVVAGFTGVPRLLEITTPPTILLFIAWSLAMARAVGSGQPRE